MGGVMNNFRDIALQTARMRQSASKKHLPSNTYEAVIWKNWKGYNRWDKKRIIEEGYDRNAPFYAAANIIAQTVSDLPVIVEYEKSGRRDTTFTHPILDALERNESREELIEQMTLYLVVTGEAYAQIITSSSSGRKRPLGLVNLPSQHVTPVEGDNFMPIQYFEIQSKKKVTLEVDEVIYIYKPDLKKPFHGMSPGVPLSELIDLNNAGITWNKNVALQGGMPPIVATAPSGMGPEEAQEVKDKFQEQSGAKNAHRLKILSGELNLHEFATEPHDAEWGNAVLMSMRMILMSLGVSSSLMNDAANKTYNNVKDSRKALYINAALPIGERIYKKISYGLRPFYKDNPLIKPDRDSIEVLQEDMKSRADWVGNTVDRGLMTRNEGRQKLRLPVINDPLADKLIISNQASDAKKPGEGSQNEQTPPVNTEE